jgi:thioredoxin 1
MSEKIKEVNEVEFNSLLKEKGPVVADFFADWCMPCKMLMPIIENLAEKYPNISFVKNNIMQSPGISRLLGVSGVPCVVLIKSGKEVDRFVGNIPEDFLERKIKEVLN